jgi:hypothetical protein
MSETELRQVNICELGSGDSSAAEEEGGGSSTGVSGNVDSGDFKDHTAGCTGSAGLG